jgi:ubiquinone/menaquinone biosynthesis C-methylase UbiE
MTDAWVLELLADPVSKAPATPANLKSQNGIIDARVFLKHTIGFRGWSDGQNFYETWDESPRRAAHFRAEIEYDRPVYAHIQMHGRILDVGGGVGTVREFLEPHVEYVSIDPYIDCLTNVDPEKVRVYTSLRKPPNFIAACAEFMPFRSESFDWIHMRSMIDHLHSPDLALMEARRVLKPDGKLVVGLYVEGGKSGKPALKRRAKNVIRACLSFFHVSQFADHHTFHPTYRHLRELIEDGGFRIDDVYWQPHWNDTVCYVTASPQPKIGATINAILTNPAA